MLYITTYKIILLLLVVNDFMKLELIADNIKNLRELKKVTRETMAEELKMSLSGYSRIERGEVDLTISKIFKISEVLEVDISKVLNFDAKEVFNIYNNATVIGGKNETANYTAEDKYREKYILLLEQEIERLKSNLK